MVSPAVSSGSGVGLRFGIGGGSPIVIKEVGGPLGSGVAPGFGLACDFR
jgi:hypothetical protein